MVKSHELIYDFIRLYPVPLPPYFKRDKMWGMWQKFCTDTKFEKTSWKGGLYKVQNWTTGKTPKNRLERLEETINMSKAEMKRENRKRNKLLQNEGKPIWNMIDYSIQTNLDLRKKLVTPNFFLKSNYRRIKIWKYFFKSKKWRKSYLKHNYYRLLLVSIFGSNQCQATKIM